MNQTKKHVVHPIRERFFSLEQSAMILFTFITFPKLSRFFFVAVVVDPKEISFPNQHIFVN